MKYIGIVIVQIVVNLETLRWNGKWSKSIKLTRKVSRLVYIIEKFDYYFTMKGYRAELTRSLKGFPRIFRPDNSSLSPFSYRKFY